MQPFTSLTSRLIPLPVDNVDTDQIIPARYLKVTDKNGLAEGLFYGWRYRQDGNPDPDFPLNQPAYQGCQILLAGDNFGCGSSREHAPWALIGWGIRAVISTSFADIFRNNALKNGLLPLVVDLKTHQALFRLSSQANNPVHESHHNDVQTGSVVTIDLECQTLKIPNAEPVHFPIDSFSKTCLLKGQNALDYLLSLDDRIGEYE